MKLKRLITLLCTLICFCLILCGCDKTEEPSSQDESSVSGEQEQTAGESGIVTSPNPVTQTLGGTLSGDYAGMMYRLTTNSFSNFFHYRMESTDKGGEYDVLSYSVELNAGSDDIIPYVEGIFIDVTFDVEIKYAKEYTAGGIIYDTLTYSCQVKGVGEKLSGIIDIEQIPVFKRSENDTDHKKFTVMNVSPNFPNIAGIISYSPLNHTYKEEVTYDTVPDFEVVANEDCIAVYMAPENKDHLYEDLAVEIELRYTYDTTGKPDQYIRYNEERITIEGNLGGCGQYFHKIENGEGKISKVAVSVVGVKGYVIKTKGCTVFQ